MEECDNKVKEEEFLQFLCIHLCIVVGVTMEEKTTPFSCLFLTKVIYL
jgi:hypothetical protein